MRRDVVCLLPCIMVGVAAGMEGAAAAQDPYAASGSDDISTVASAVLRGRRAGDAGQWSESKGAYEEALRAASSTWTTDAKRAEIAGELGLCELELRRYRDASEHLAQALSRRSALRQSLQLRFEAGLRQAETRVARLYLTVSPADAEVWLDGRSVGGGSAQSYELFLEPGQHTVRARLAGHDEASQSFSVVADQVQTASMKLRLAPQAGARGPGATDAARAPHVTSSPFLTTPRVVGLALTTATAATGALFLMRSAALQGDSRERRDGLREDAGWDPDACGRVSRPPACSEVSGLADDGDRFALIGAVTLAVSGVIGAVTVASYFVDFSSGASPPAPHGGLRIVPIIAGSQAGVWVQGAW